MRDNHIMIKEEIPLWKINTEIDNHGQNTKKVSYALHVICLFTH